MPLRVLLIAALTLLRIGGQQRSEGNPFDNDLKQSWQLYRAGKLDEAANAFQAISAKAAATGDQQAQAWAHDAMGAVLEAKTEYPAARAEYQKALAFYESARDQEGTADAHNHLGRICSAMGERAAAREHYQRALSAFETLGLLRKQANVLGNLDHLPDEDRDALNARALAIARQLGDKGLEAEVRHRMGDSLFLKGVFDAAEEQYKQAGVLYEQGGAPGALAGLLTSEGRLQRAHGHPEKSLELYRRALKLQRENHDRLGSIQSINAMAVAYGLLNDNAKAVELYQQALALARGTGSPRYINFELANLAGAYLSIGRNQEAADILAKVLRENPEIEFANLRWQTLSAAYYHLGRFPESIDAATKSVDIARAGKLAEALPGPLLWRARGREKVGDSGAALADAEACLRAVEDLRAHLVPSDFMKRGFAERNQEGFELAIRLLTNRGEAARSWEVAEQARSRAFLDLLAARSVHQESQSRPGEPPDAGIDSPGYAQPALLADVRTTAQRLNTTVISYWVAPEITYMWLVTPEGEIHEASSAVTSKRLTQLAGLLWSGGSPEIRRAARELYRLLLGPVEKQLPEKPGSLVTIEPHGVLMTLPFAAVKDARGRYLVERFTLDCVPALSLLTMADRRQPETPESQRRFLLVADPSRIPKNADGKSLPPLPGARREVSSIARILPASRVTTLEGSAANEQRVRDLAGQSSVIHFATHGIVRDDQPWESFLALSQGPLSEKPPAGDGRLTARKIYDLNLHADLIFLSACRSARGKVTGDGIVGLTRAFLYAGTSTIIASLWDVADEPTYRLTSAFYRSWLAGNSKSSALRSAQLDLLHALRAGQLKIHTPDGDIALTEQPVFWAGFVLQGMP